MVYERTKQTDVGFIIGEKGGGGNPSFSAMAHLLKYPRAGTFCNLLLNHPPEPNSITVGKKRGKIQV